MFDNLINMFRKKLNKKGNNKFQGNSRETAKERLHLVLMQDRANVSADFLELMKQEIIEVIKKYIDVDESAIDVRLTNKENSDGSNGAPALYANIPILNIKNEARKLENKPSEQTKEENANKEQNSQKAKDEEKPKEEKENKKEENTEKNTEKNKSNNQEKKETKIEKENKQENEEKSEKEENKEEQTKEIVNTNK